MSYEYEMKDILKTMIDNNEPHWSADTMDMVRVEIHNVYAQASKAGEYEAKAKAFDRIVEERNRIEKSIHTKKYPQAFTDEAFWNIDDIIIDAEGGESDAKK